MADESFSSAEAASDALAWRPSGWAKMGAAAKNIGAVLAREGAPPQVDQLPGRRSGNRSKRQLKAVLGL